LQQRIRCGWGKLVAGASDAERGRKRDSRLSGAPRISTGCRQIGMPIKSAELHHDLLRRTMTYDFIEALDYFEKRLD